ncbi:hypothetical protein PFICI_08603 [Pestalotiopsis fici W106-1]|uniref:Uncharacterized protein n=1 Tax=Pestalotiopsis fici (strain W106-1 / CGMCC3.15140) TaxID=1229662 RepID=W3WY45_PESFW|nr:uncharacterized protein PFICI_08603 [Pestalotiopsis fici W106-1]ETS78750.1 hypothetical protein PFICI_08603 [Pestalotiopsis fici W106-1]
MLHQPYMKLFPISLPPADTFAGQRAVVTGGTTGLGLAAAAHLINLGAAEVITRGRSKGRARALELDMEDYTSIVEFAAKVKDIGKGSGGVDVVILNAGMIGVEPRVTANGWEQNIQVNTISSILLATLLLPHLKAQRASRSSPAHITLVSSGRFAEPNIVDWPKWHDEGILAHFSKPENWPGSQGMYPITKLSLQYGFRELAELARGPDGRPDVIMNTVCPGAVKTDLSRGYAENGVAFRVALGIFSAVFAKSAENGARAYMAAVTTKEEEHGKMVQFYWSNAQLAAQEAKNLGSEAGRRLQSWVWDEICKEMVSKVPETKEFLKA